MTLARTANTPLTVASVPANHVYVRHLSPPGTAHHNLDVIRLADPDPDDINQYAAAKWWPPAMLEPDWVRAHDGFDLFHIQFGFDARTPEDLRALVADLRIRNIPIIYTVHDLRNPHHATPEAHDAQLDVLIPAADALITLTAGAATEIEERWGRRALVLPHPHVVDFDTMDRVQAERAARVSSGSRADTFRIGVHVKSLRASMNPEPVIRSLIETVKTLPGAVLQVDGHPDVLDPSGERYDEGLASLVMAASDRREIDLRIHDFFDDDQLWQYLSSLDVSVLPYRFGTHSGWLEACHDLGTAVIAPDCGYYREQAPIIEYVNNESGFDAASLDSAVRTAYLTRPAPVISVQERRLQRARIAEAHGDLYRSLLG
jgi:glycosyltransferase involved in cell wall biosynthesis